ncbi:hypothetical protein BGZ65_000028, partial [Modicella reniformis]
AILSRREIDDLIGYQERNYEDTPPNQTAEEDALDVPPNQDAEEDALDVPCQYPACTPVGVGTPEEMREGAMAWFDFQKRQGEAEAAIKRIRKEDLNRMPQQR